MTKKLKRFLKNLIVRFTEYKRPVDLTRENLKLNPVNWKMDLNDRLKEDKEYASEAQNLLRSNVLKREIDEIIRNEVEYIAQKARNEQDMLLSRGTINGVSYLKERLEKIVFEYKAKQMEETMSDEDKFSTISSSF